MSFRDLCDKKETYPIAIGGDRLRSIVIVCVILLVATYYLGKLLVNLFGIAMGPSCTRDAERSRPNRQFPPA